MAVNFNTVSWEEFASSLPRTASDTDRLMAAFVYRLEHEGLIPRRLRLLPTIIFGVPAGLVLLIFLQQLITVQEKVGCRKIARLTVERLGV